MNNQEPTIVTMFYNIRVKEGNKFNSQFNRSVTTYFDFSKQFILKLPYNLIIFTDDDECIEMIIKERNTYKNKTCIYNKKFEDTYFYKYSDKLWELREKFVIINGQINHETPMYIILNNNKFDFMEYSININPFNSSHFIWLDFAINHVALNVELISEWINNIPDKIKQLCINPYIEDLENKEMFRYIYHHTAGGLFTGSKDYLLKYCELFKKKTQQIYNEDWYQIDEAVMTMVQRENPELFEFFYGDYQGIVSNYVSPIHNIDLILKGSQKFINFNKPKQAYDILCYCSKYFEMNITNDLIYLYINQHIIVDYYNNNKLLLNSVIELINLLKKMVNNDRIINLLNSNVNNIIYYENKEYIIN